MEPGNSEAMVQAYTPDGKPEKRVSCTIQQGRATTLNVDFSAIDRRSS